MPDRDDGPALLGGVRRGGPGLGAGTVGVILGLVGSVLIAVFAFFWYPIKRTFKKWTSSGDESLEDDEELEATEEPK